MACYFSTNSPEVIQQWIMREHPYWKGIQNPYGVNVILCIWEKTRVPVTPPLSWNTCKMFWTWCTHGQPLLQQFLFLWFQSCGLVTGRLRSLADEAKLKPLLTLVKALMSVEVFVWWNNGMTDIPGHFQQLLINI